MACGIEGDVDNRMAEELLHDLGINALYEQQRGAGVLKIMNPAKQGRPVHWRNGSKEWVVRFLAFIVF